VDAVLQQHQRLAGIVLPRDAEATAAAALREAIGEAFVAGFRRVMLLCAGLAVASAASAWWLIGRRTS
jgi:hypothetical protein